MDMLCGAGDWLVDLLLLTDDASANPGETLAELPDAADVTLSRDEATDPT